MKKLFSLFVILANFFALFASPVGPDQAKVIALNFMCQQSPSITRNSECALVYTKSNDRSTTYIVIDPIFGDCDFERPGWSEKIRK